MTSYHPPPFSCPFVAGVALNSVGLSAALRPPPPPSAHREFRNESAIVRTGWATEGPALLFLQTSPPISHAGPRPGKCYLFLLKLTAGEILTFTVCAVVVFGGQARVCGLHVAGGGSFLCMTCPSSPFQMTFPLAPAVEGAPFCSGHWRDGVGYKGDP